MRVDVVDRNLHRRQRLAHAARRPFAGRRDHVGAVGGRAVAGDLAVDARAARLGALVFLQHQHAGAAGDDEAVAVLVVGARGARRRRVVGRRHRAHRVEQHRQRPVEILAAAGEHHVLLAEQDLFGRRADAMVRGRAGRRDRIGDALDLEPGAPASPRRSSTSPSAPRRDRRASGPWSRAMSAASTMVRVEGPPEPMIMPVRSLEMSSGSRPASRIA